MRNIDVRKVDTNIYSGPEQPRFFLSGLALHLAAPVVPAVLQFPDSW